MNKHRDVYLALGVFLALFFLGIVSPLVPNRLNFWWKPAIYTPPPQPQESTKILTVTTLQSSTPVENCEAGCSFEQAFQLAPDGATIVFAKGLTGTITLRQDLSIYRNLTIIGPQANAESEKIILDGGWKPIVWSVFSGHGIVIESPVALTLKNLTIRGVVGRGMGGGGAISNNGGLLTIENSTIESSLAQKKGGGAIYNNWGTVIVKNSLLQRNWAGFPDDVRFNDNSSLYRGGAIYNEGGTVTLLNSALLNNRSNGDGGAIFNDQGNFVIQNSVIGNNTATFVNASRFDFRQLPLIIASTTGSGGAVAASTGNITITRSTFFENSAALGGALYNSLANVTVSNSTFYQNGARIGGAIYNSAGNVVIKNATFNANRGHTLLGGSAIFSFERPITVQNTILSNSLGDFSNCGGSVIDGGHNLQYPGNSCGLWIQSTDPLLEKFQPFKIDTTDIHASPIGLQPSSPAIDMGDNAVCSNSEIGNIDQRGKPRPIDGGSGQAICDIGAFEYAKNYQ